MNVESSDFRVTGTGDHTVDSRILTNESAVEEPFNNMIGMVLQAAIGLGLQQLHDLNLPFEQDLLPIGQLGHFQKSTIFCNWSPTTISDKNWTNLLNSMPQSDAVDKAHAASVFNRGIPLFFERLSCNTFYAFRQSRAADGSTKRQIIRYGKSLDDAEGSEYIRVLRVDWDSASKMQLVGLELESPIDSQPPGDALRQMWDFFCAKADKYGKADGDFFATAIMPIRDIDGKPLLRVEEDGELCFLDSSCQYIPLRRFYAEAYMYKSSGLTAPVKHVRAVIQGKEIDLTETVWDKIAAAPSSIFQIYDIEGTLIGAGQCKALTDEEIEHGIKPGVRIALKNSTKFVNADPESFFDDRMCDERVQKSKETLSRKLAYYMEKGTNAQKKIEFGSKSWLDPLEYMDRHPKSYSANDFNQFLRSAIKIGDSNGGGKHLLSKALGFKTYSLIELKVEVHTGPQKSHFIKQPAGDLGYPYIAGGLGAIYRAITEITFHEAKECLRAMRAPLTLPGPPPPPGPHAVVPYDAADRDPAAAAAATPGRRGERSRKSRQTLDMGVLGGGEDKDPRQKKRSRVKEEREAALDRLEQELKEYAAGDYLHKFSPLMDELKKHMP